MAETNLETILEKLEAAIKAGVPPQARVVRNATEAELEELSDWGFVNIEDGEQGDVTPLLGVPRLYEWVWLATIEVISRKMENPPLSNVGLCKAIIEAVEVDRRLGIPEIVSDVVITLTRRSHEAEVGEGGEIGGDVFIVSILTATIEFESDSPVG